MKTSTRRMIRWVLGASLALTAAGCVKAKKNLFLVKLDQRNESIAILMTHEGFYVDTSNDANPLEPELAEARESKLLAEAKKNLAAFTTSDRVIYLFGGFFDRVDLNPDPEDQEERASAKRKIAGLIELEHGKFLLNRRGELSGYQKIAIPRAKAFAKAINKMISEDLKSEKSRPDDFYSPLSRKSVLLIREAAAKGHDWFRFEDGRIVFDVPMTRDDAEMMLAKKETDKEIREGFDQLREVVGAFRITRSRDGLAIVFGVEKHRVVTLTIPEEKNSQPVLERELLEFARELPGAFDKSQDVETLIKKFVSPP